MLFNPSLPPRIILPLHTSPYLSEVGQQHRNVVLGFSFLYKTHGKRLTSLAPKVHPQQQYVVESKEKRAEAMRLNHLLEGF